MRSAWSTTRARDDRSARRTVPRCGTHSARPAIVAEERRRRKSPQPAVDAAIGFTARSPAPLALIPIEDISGLAEQPNVPGTIDEHPNWRRRLDRPAAEVLGTPDAKRRLAILRERRQ